MFNEYDVVELCKDLPEYNLSKGAFGTILLIYDQLPHPPAYEVEFVSEHGKTLATVAVQEGDIKLIASS